MKQNGNKIFFVIVGLIIAGLLYLLAPILTPFLAGAIIAYLINPVVTKIQRLGLGRVLSVVLVFLILIILLVLGIFLLIPLIQNEIDTLVDFIPNTISWVQNIMLPWLSKYIGPNKELINVASLKTLIANNIAKTGNAAEWLFATALYSGVVIAEWAINLILIPVVAFYLLCDWKKVIQEFDNLLPRNIEPTVAKIMKECDAVLSEFFRGEFIVILILCCLYSFGLSVIGLQLAILIGIIAGLLSLVPYLGFIVGIFIASIAAYVQTSDVYMVGSVCAVFIIVHLIENLFLAPYFVGNRIGLHPVAVIFAVLAGGCLFGFLGVLLALPAAAVIMVWLRYLHQHYRKSDLYKA